MTRRNAAEAAFGKALSLWEAPEGAGEARVCLASTFTFKADFFETECLGRFLGMNTHPEESDAVSYLVEREERLAAARVAVLVDRRHATEKESLRWDVLGVLVSGAIQHSKISLLAWSNHVRVIVGSGNLTEPGYRKNLEVFGALELSRKNGGDLPAVRAVIDFLLELIDASVGSDAAEGAKRRARDALQSVRALIRGWLDTQAKSPVLVLGGPGRPVLEQVSNAFPSGSVPRLVYVVSPFFDSDGTEVADALLRVIAKRGQRDLYIDVRTEEGPDGRTRVFAPLPMILQLANQAELTVRSVLSNQRNEIRDLHAKMICLESEESCLLLAGSSNFTRAGLGVGHGTPNFEANLAYRVRQSDPERKVLDQVWPELAPDPLNIDSEALVWDARPDEEGETCPPLPAAFEDASFSPGNPSSLVICLCETLPETWCINTESGTELLSSSRGTHAGKHAVPWPSDTVPFIVEVTWSHVGGTAVASWPVNVSNPANLPPPEALQSLTLEELLQVLASTRPIPEAVADVLNRRKRKSAKGDVEANPLKRFESQSFLLRRTKRLALALERMRERLALPTSSREAFEWRVFGPVGPMALADSYVRETGLEGEAKFCLAEIALALRRVRVEQIAADGLSPAVITDCLSSAIARLVERAGQVPSVPEIDRYVAAAFVEAMR